MGQLDHFGSFKNVFCVVLVKSGWCCCLILQQHPIHRITHEQSVSVSHVWKTKHWNIPTRFLTLSGHSWSFLFWNANAFNAIWKKWCIISCEAEWRWHRKTQIMTKWLLWYDWKKITATSVLNLKVNFNFSMRISQDFYWFHHKIKRKNVCMKKPVQRMKNRHFLVSKIWSCFLLI